MRSSSILSTLLGLAACGSPTDGPPALPPAPDAGAMVIVQTPPVTCRPGDGWDPGDAAFVDRTEAWGLSGHDGHALATADVDGDGWPDLLTMDAVTNRRGTTRLWLNRPGPTGRTFVDFTAESGLLSTRDGGSGRLVNLAAFGDVDGDGDVDALTAIWRDHAQDDVFAGDVGELMLNDGTGRFTFGAPLPYADATVATTRLTSGIALTDQDLDGRLDAFLTHWYVQPPFSTAFGQHPLLFRGADGGVMRDVTAEVGIELLYTSESLTQGTSARPLFGATACDLDDDGRPDLLGAAYGRMWNLLWMSDGERYVERGRDAGVAGDDIGSEWNENGNTFSITCGDIDGDGDLDLYTSEIKHPGLPDSDPSTVLWNLGAATARFQRVDRDLVGLSPPPGPAREEGGQNGGLLDFDNDGRLDVYLAGSSYDRNEQAGWIFQQLSDAEFRYLGAGSGFDHPCPHGLAIADFDRDGDQDIVVGTYGCASDWDDDAGDDYVPQPFRFYDNVATDRNYLTVRLVGGGPGAANGTGIGARVRVRVDGVTLTREVHGSWGRAALSREPVAHFGLGRACAVERVEVRWPDRDGTVQVFEDVVINQLVELRYGDGEARYPLFEAR